MSEYPVDIVNSLVNLSTYMAQTKTDQAKDIAILKQAIHLQEAGALALIESLPTLPVAEISSTSLGSNIDVYV